MANPERARFLYSTESQIQPFIYNCNQMQNLAPATECSLKTR
jgi:hypothetical protein